MNLSYKLKYMKTRKNKSSHKNLKLKTKKLSVSSQKGGLNNMVASAGSDNIIRFWDGDNGDLLHKFIDEKHAGKINCIAFSSNNQYLASASDDKKIFIWNTSTKELEKELSGHSNKINCVSWKPNSIILASGSDNGSVKLWDTLNGECVYTFLLLKNYNVDCVSWGIERSNGTHLIAGYNNTKQITNIGKLKIWNVKNFQNEINISNISNNNNTTTDTVIPLVLFEENLFKEEKIQSIFFSDKLIILTNKFLRILNFNNEKLSVIKPLECQNFKLMTVLDTNTVIISNESKLLKINLKMAKLDGENITPNLINIYSITSFYYTSSIKLLIGSDNFIYLYDDKKKQPISEKFHIKKGSVQITSIATQNRYTSSLRVDDNFLINQLKKLSKIYSNENIEYIHQVSENPTISLAPSSVPSESFNFKKKIENRTKQMKEIELNDYLKSNKLFFDNNFEENRKYRLQNYKRFKLNVAKFKLIVRETKRISPSTYSTSSRMSSNSNGSSSPSTNRLGFYNNNTGTFTEPTIPVPSPKVSFTILNNKFNSLYSNTETDGNLQKFIGHILNNLQTMEYSFFKYKSTDDFKNNFINIMIHIYKEIILKDFISETTKFKNKRYVFYLILFKLLDFILVNYKAIFKMP